MASTSDKYFEESGGFTVVTGAADDVEVEISATACPSNRVWLIPWACVTHDDPTSRVVTLSVYDGTNKIVVAGAASQAAGDVNALFLNRHVVVPPGGNLVADISALTLGDKVTIKASKLEIDPKGLDFEII